MAQVIMVCAEEYRYNFLRNCEGYKVSVQLADELLEQLLSWRNLSNETR
jgi:hypothetical protein